MTCLEENRDKYCFKGVTTALGQRRTSRMVQSRWQGPGAVLSAEIVSSQPARGWWSLSAMGGSPAQMHTFCPCLCLKRRHRGVPPNPVKPHTCLQQRPSCYCRRNIWLKQWWKLYKHSHIGSLHLHRDPFQDTCHQSSFGNPWTPHRDKPAGSAGPWRTPYTAAAVREVRNSLCCCSWEGL